ncbi:MAG TPA: hypothetical protein VHJ19_11560 [Gammaproteobacteria bacterium]|nr:hypothetical protein [Gammaproteobacteria bacterium]
MALFGPRGGKADRGRSSWAIAHRRCGGCMKGGYLGVLAIYLSELAHTFCSAIWAFVTCSVITIIMSVLTCPTTVRTVARIDLFAYAMVKRHAAILLPATGVVGMVVLTIALLLNIIFF